MKMVVFIEGQVKEAIVCMKVVDGMDTCVVYFIPRVLASDDRVLAHVNKFVEVKEHCECSSDNAYKQSKSKKILECHQYVFQMTTLVEMNNQLND